VISFNDEFFNEKAPVDLKIKVLKETNDTLAEQYIGFCRVFNSFSIISHIDLFKYLDFFVSL